MSAWSREPRRFGVGSTRCARPPRGCRPPTIDSWCTGTSSPPTSSSTAAAGCGDDFRPGLDRGRHPLPPRQRWRAGPLGHAPLHVSRTAFRADLTGASDQYAFCVAAWMVLTGELPFDDGLDPDALADLKRRVPRRTRAGWRSPSHDPRAATRHGARPGRSLALDDGAPARAPDPRSPDVGDFRRRRRAPGSPLRVRRRRLPGRDPNARGGAGRTRGGSLAGSRRGARPGARGREGPRARAALVRVRRRRCPGSARGRRGVRRLAGPPDARIRRRHD